MKLFQVLLAGYTFQHQLPTVDGFPLNRLLQRTPKRVLSQDAQQNGGTSVWECICRPLYKPREVVKKGCLNLILTEGLRVCQGSLAAIDQHINRDQRRQPGIEADPEPLDPWA